MTKQSNRHDLALLIRSSMPIVALETDDEESALRLINEIAISQFRTAQLWTRSDGLRRMDLSDTNDTQHEEPEEALRAIKALNSNDIVVLADFHPYLNDPLNVRLLKDIALRHGASGLTLILASHKLSLPAELRRLSTRAELALPSEEELRQLIYDAAREWYKQSGQKSVDVKGTSVDVLIQALAGLTAHDARRLIRTAILDDGILNRADIDAIHHAKHQLIGPKEALSLEYDTASFADVGGLDNMKKWLEQRQQAFHRKATDLDPPKGLLLLGIQGSGKSLAAKAVAGLWQAPLMRFDFGAMYNKFYGETERNLREALRAAEAMAPCVLWFDEIEKGIGHSSDDDGVSRRVLGTLLTWMAEKQSAVFVVATANDISRLPPELVRKGRFDEVFFVDLPSQSIRETIFAIHLKKRGLDVNQYDRTRLGHLSRGFSGAEIEQAVVDAFYAARTNDADPSTQDIADAISRTRPLSVLMAEKITDLRHWSQGRTVPASSEGPND